ncbi:hypothetical protein Zmor_010088 [Zophobas morio]|uniref:Gustatory receptor n=1 Tax=Zophobas morio TaxID=2755281 RepID=A0AA38MJB5_9CUCU|nr:hypothetical protein Zmor_010088 [Zophobas morio]
MSANNAWVLLSYFIYLPPCFVAIAGETLLFAYLIIVTKGTQIVNTNLKKCRSSRNELKTILTLLIDIKNDIQKFSQVCIFFKLFFVVTEIATSICTFLTHKEQAFNPVSMIICWINIYWTGYLLLELFLVIAPHILFYKNVLQMVEICADLESNGYKSTDLLHLRFILTKIKFTAHGLLDLDWPLMFTVNVGLTSWEVMFCHLRFLFISLLFLSGESLIFFYLLACWNILKVFNFFIKEERNVEIKQIKEILHLYHGVKTDIQRISSLFVFFKLIHVAVELATTLYGLFREVETQEVDFLTKIHAFLVTGYWFFELTMETLLVLCPYMFLSEQVLKTVHACNDKQESDNLEYKELELFYLQAQLTNFKFTCHGLLELDWPLLYVVVAQILTHMIYLIQFNQMWKNK